MKRDEANGLTLASAAHFPAPDPEAALVTGKPQLDGERLVRRHRLGEYLAEHAVSRDFDGATQIGMSVEELVEEHVGGPAGRAGAVWDDLDSVRSPRRT